jgi:acetylornithine/N-succinyldiaminopimelate aminotransferase
MCSALRGNLSAGAALIGPVPLAYDERMTSTLPPVETPVAPPAADDMAQGIMSLERDHLLQNYARYPLVLVRGKGSYVWDTQGRRYLDLITGIGVNALGYAHPRIVKVIREQAGRLIHCSNLYYHSYQGPLAQRLARMSGLDRAFFANSGTEAVEGALKIARAYGRGIDPRKYEIVSLDNSFHGRTLGALSVTGQPKYRADFEPLLPGAKFVPINDIPALEAAVNERTAAIFLEMIQGEGGIFPLTPEFARKARALADQHGALLVADETQCGVGRPGVYFAYQLASPVIQPDVMCAAKPVASGIPLGFVMASEKAAAAIKPGMHGSTFGGGALACRVSLEFLDILEEILPSIQRSGLYFKTRLEDLARKHASVKEVRGFGLMLGMELTIPGKQVVLDALAAGLLINCTHETILRFLPAYTITEAEIDRAVKILDKLLAKVGKQ